MSNEKTIWDYLIKSGMTDEGAAGMIGNLYAESGLDPKKCEQLCLNRLREFGLGDYTSETYTEAVDSGAITREQFLHPIPERQYGYGIAQWTTPDRKAMLYDSCMEDMESIGNLYEQLDFLCWELKHTYQNVWKVLSTTHDVNEASDVVLTKFEMPKDPESYIDVRRGFSKSVYARWHKEEKTYMNVFDRQKVIDLALKEDGYLEKSASWYRKYGKDGLYDKVAGAGSDNYTKYGYEMHQLYPSVMDFPAAWCDCCVDWLFMQAYGTANAKKLLAGDFDDYTVASAQLYKNKNAWRAAGTVPEKGWQIFFKNSTRICHTGLVVDVVKSNGIWYVVTVEGNTSSAAGVVANGGCVRIKQYPVNYSSIAGYGVPPYDDENAAKKIEFVPHWVNADGKWYYREAENRNAHGWQLINKHWYYFKANGEMSTGLTKIGERWFLLATPEMSNDYEGACCIADESGAQHIWNIG